MRVSTAACLQDVLLEYASAAAWSRTTPRGVNPQQVVEENWTIIGLLQKAGSVTVLQSLQQLVALLESAPDLLMREHFLILRWVLARVEVATAEQHISDCRDAPFEAKTYYNHLWCPNAGRVRRFYTFDHRRLWCTHMAVCPTLRLEVILAGPLVDEMFSKIGFGTRAAAGPRGGGRGQTFAGGRVGPRTQRGCCVRHAASALR